MSAWCGAEQPGQRREPHARRLVAGEHAPGQPDRAQHRRARPRDLAALRGGAQEADVESRVVGDEHCAAGEFEERGQHRFDLRRVADHRRGDAGEFDDLRRNASAGVDKRGQLAEHLAAAHLDRADLGDGVDVVTVAVRAAAGRLEVDDDERRVLNETSASGSTSAKLSWPMR